MKVGTALLLFAISGSCFAGTVYRFKVDGKVVIKDSVPPEYVSLGYEVLNSQGRTIRVVPAALTAEERAVRKAQEQAQKAREETVRQQVEKDHNLMRLYPGQLDIERARQRKLDEIASKTEELRKLVGITERKLEVAQGQAANYERRGQEIPAELRIEVVNLQDAIRDAKKGIAGSQQELDATNQEFDALRLRQRVLLVYPQGTLNEDVDLEHLEKTLGKDRH